MKLFRRHLWLVLLLPACSTTPVDVDVEALSRFVPQTAEQELKVHWGYQLPSTPINEHLDTLPAIDGDKLYLADQKGILRCLSLQNGKVLWQKQYEHGFSAGPRVAGSSLLVGSSDAHVLKLNKDDGSLLWKSRISSEVLATPQSSGDRIIARAGDGKVYGLRADNGKQLWVYDRNVPLLSLRGASRPLLVGDRVIVGFASGKLAALSVKNGKLLWEASVAVARGRSELERMVDIDGQLSYANGMVYASTYQGRIAALDADSGRILWTRDMSSYLGTVLQDQHLYLTDAEGQVWALDSNTGATLWKQDRLAALASTAPTVKGQQLLIADRLGNVYWLNREDGRLLAKADGNDILLDGGIDSLADKLDTPLPFSQFWPDLIGSAHAPLIAGERILLSYRRGALVAAGEPH